MRTAPVSVHATIEVQEAHAFRLLPDVSLRARAGSSGASRPPGPMLLLRVLRDDLRGDSEGALLKAGTSNSPSAMFPFRAGLDMVCVVVWNVGLRRDEYLGSLFTCCYLVTCFTTS